MAKTRRKYNKCNCTHSNLRALGFKEREIKGHHKNCKTMV